MTELLTTNLPAKVAMVVPCYNESTRWNYPYWEELIKVKNVDWYFIDDGSRDSTYTIISSYSSLVIKIFASQNSSSSYNIITNYFLLQ